MAKKRQVNRWRIQQLQNMRMHILNTLTGTHHHWKVWIDELVMMAKTKLKIEKLDILAVALQQVCQKIDPHWLTRRESPILQYLPVSWKSCS